MLLSPKLDIILHSHIRSQKLFIILFDVLIKALNFCSQICKGYKKICKVKNKKIITGILLEIDIFLLANRTSEIYTKDFSNLKLQSCKLYNNIYTIASTQITKTEIFAFIAILFFKLLSRKILFINRKDNRNC